MHRRVDAEGVVAVERCVAGAARNALRLKISQELGARQPAEWLRIVAESEEVVGVARHARVALQRPDPGNARESLRQVEGIRAAALGLLVQASQLGVEDRRLPLRHPVVAAEEAVLVPAALTHAPNVN